MQDKERGTMDIWEKRVSGRGNSKCKGPGTGFCSLFAKLTSKELLLNSCFYKQRKLNLRAIEESPP